MANLKIPTESLPALEALAKLEDNVFESFLAATKNLHPTLDPSKAFEQINFKKIAILEGEVKEIHEMLMGLHWVMRTHEISVDEISEDVGKVVSELTVGYDFKPIAAKLVSRIKLLLSSSKSLAVTAKAMDVITEQERTFYESRILTDIRPIFTDSPTTPAAAVIIHNLKIEYHYGSRHEEFYFALDTDDIQQLKSVIERAEEKEKALEAIIKGAKLEYLKP